MLKEKERLCRVFAKEEGTTLPKRKERIKVC
jgi:hypothetical protein